ncbi:MAG: hypothetical protein WDN00_01895 [Limisphaerales bacterium]
MPPAITAPFTSAVATVVGSAVVDGKLEIHNGDVIEADYVEQLQHATQSHGHG